MPQWTHPNRPTETGGRFVLDFEFRSDCGPRLVGPFDTRGDAELYVSGLRLDEVVYCICPIATPQS